jgi:hypothetical protein
MNRPTSVTVLGILNLVFAAWGFLGVAMVVAMDFMPMPGNAKNPMLDLMQQNAVYAVFTKASMMLGIVATIVLGLAGIGLLMMRPWGRWLSIGYAIYGILSVIVGAVLFYTFLLGPLLAKEAALPPGPEKVGITAGIVGGVVGTCSGLIYPIVLLIFMYRPNVVEAMKATEQEDFKRL